MSERKTLIIAEAGVNHNGSLEMARRLIEVAAQAGADFVKFQSFSADRLATRTARKAAYQSKITGADESQHRMLSKLELSEQEHRELITHCEANRIGFFSTGFDIESVTMLAGLGQTLFKVPSGELTNLPYLRHIARLAKTIILSTGMASLGDVEAAIDALESSGASREKIVVLHCTTEYPAPMHDVNLRAMISMRTAFGVQVGYSDHTKGIEVAIAAVALGAQVIEKHFTLDRELPGPDHRASLQPDELKAMVDAIRNIELALGDGIKRVVPSEIANRSVARKSIVAAREIRKGEAFTEHNLTTKRPGIGLSPMLWDTVVNRISPRDFMPDELIEL